MDWRQSKSGNDRKGWEFADDQQERSCDLGGFDMSAGGTTRLRVLAGCEKSGVKSVECYRGHEVDMLPMTDVIAGDRIEDPPTRLFRFSSIPGAPHSSIPSPPAYERWLIIDKVLASLPRLMGKTARLIGNCSVEGWRSGCARLCGAYRFVKCIGAFVARARPFQLIATTRRRPTCWVLTAQGRRVFPQLSLPPVPPFTILQYHEVHDRLPHPRAHCPLGSRRSKSLAIRWRRIC